MPRKDGQTVLRPPAHAARREANERAYRSSGVHTSPSCTREEGRPGAAILARLKRAPHPIWPPSDRAVVRGLAFLEIPSRHLFAGAGRGPAAATEPCEPSPPPAGDRLGERPSAGGAGCAASRSCRAATRALS